MRSNVYLQNNFILLKPIFLSLFSDIYLHGNTQQLCRNVSMKKKCCALLVCAGITIHALCFTISCSAEVMCWSGGHM